VITITRRQAREIRAVFRRALGILSRSAGPPLRIQAGPEGVSVRCRSSMAAVEFRQAGDLPQAQFAVPFGLLSDIEGGRPEPVTLEQEGDQVVARWNNGQVPQIHRYDVGDDDDAAEFPTVPEKLAENDPSLLTALRSAAETTDKEATRYALGCVQMRGGEGRIAATDGSQLLVQAGFEFPWEGERLIPRSTVFASREFSNSEQAAIGADDEWVILCVGLWTLWFAVEREARFPQIDDHLRNPADAPTTLRLTDADADFLQQSIKQLPVDDSFNDPVTVDLNGEVVVRGRAAEKAVPTELVLSNSAVVGKSLQLSTNRKFLARALKLGFREISLFGPDAPVICRNAHRDYVWMVLDAKEAIAAHPNAVRIVSGADATSPPPPLAKRNETTMSKTPSGPDGGSRTDGNSPSKQATTTEESPLQQAEALQQTLQLALSQTRALATTLRKRKKQSQLMKSTLASLRKLQTVDV
jgi:hypothetical protein